MYVKQATIKKLHMHSHMNLLTIRLIHTMCLQDPEIAELIRRLYLEKSKAVKGEIACVCVCVCVCVYVWNDIQ